MGLYCVPQAASANTTFNFDAVAAAYGIDSTVNNESIPLGLTIEAAGPVAQSHLSSNSQSDGFAAFPYPGDSVVGLPALVKGALLPGFPIPAVPTYASSSYGEPANDANFPGIELYSSSDQHSTHTRAVAGTSAIGATSTADVVQEDDDVKATATTSLQALSLGGLLSISGVQSTASAILGSDGKVTTSSSMSIGQISVGGLNLTLPKTSPANPPVPVPIPGLPSFTLPLPAIPLPLGGLTIPTPDIGFENGQFTISLPLFPGVKFALPTDVLLKALNALGIDVKVQNAIKTPTGVVAANITFTTTLPAPPKNQYVNGTTPVSFSLGRASASFANASAVPSTGGFLGGGGTGTTTGSSGGVLPGGSNLGSGSLGGGTLGGGATAPASAGVSGTTSLRSGSTPAQGGSGGVTTVALSHKLYSSIVPLYVALIGVAVGAALAVQFVRYLGVRSSWRF